MAPFYPGFDHKGYNPRRGAGNTGRVREEDFSIDGRSWDYRDPYNQNAIDRQNQNREKGRFTTNQNAYEIANPLYDYDYGVVRDAAKELGINNVDEKKEVKQIQLLLGPLNAVFCHGDGFFARFIKSLAALRGHLELVDGQVQ